MTYVEQIVEYICFNYLSYCDGYYQAFFHVFLRKMENGVAHSTLKMSVLYEL